MNALHALRHHEVAGTSFHPIAEIDVPSSWFSAKGLTFAPGVDDLDAYEIAAFSDRERTFAIMRYATSAPGKVSLMAAQQSGASTTSALIAAVASLFDLPLSAFHWQGENTAAAA